MKVEQQYGLLTLIKKVSPPENRRQYGTYWLCKCKCGQECIKNEIDLKAGDTKSCGCLKKRQPIFDKNKVEISNNAGVYGFQNIYNGHWYIGKTKNLYARYCDHKHSWKKYQEKQFYQAIQKYGWDSFNYYILKEYSTPPSKKELSECEEYFIKKYNSYKEGYNASEISSGGFYTEEHQNKCIKILEELNLKQKNENHPNTDFTKEEILNIFELGMLGAPAKIVYEKYKDHKITYESFKQIYRGEHFKDYLPKDWNKRPAVSTNSKMWGSWILDIRTRLNAGESSELVFDDYKNKCTPLDFRRIKNNQTYKQIQPCID